MKFNLIERLKRKNSEKKIIYDNVEYTIVPVDPDHLNTEIPINFNIFLLMEKSKNLIQYFKSEHLFTLKDIQKLKKNTRGKLFIFKNEFDSFLAYKNFSSQFSCNKKSKNSIVINRISMARNSEPGPNKHKDLCLTSGKTKDIPGNNFINENLTFLNMVKKIEVLSKNNSNDKKIKLLFDAMRYHGHNLYRRIKAFSETEKTLFPIARMLFKEDPVVRLFYLSLFFCVKNRVEDKNIIFHLIMNVLKKNLSDKCWEFYSEYWSNLVFKEGISPDAIINVTDTIDFCHQFSTIIGYFTPSTEETGSDTPHKKTALLTDAIKSISYK